MTEAYAVQSTLGVTDNLSPAINRLIQLVARLNASFKNLAKMQGDLDRMAKSMTAMGAAMAKATAATNNFGEAAGKAGRAGATGFNAAASSADRASTAIARLVSVSRTGGAAGGGGGGIVPSAMRLGYSGGRSLDPWSRVMPGGAYMNGGWGGGGRGGGGRLSLGAPGGPGGGGMSPGGFRFPWPQGSIIPPGGGGAGGGGGSGGGGISPMGGAIGAGGLMMGGMFAKHIGDSILGGVSEVFRAGGAWDHQIALATEAGISRAGVNMLANAARNTATAVPGTTFTENFKAGAELRSVLGSVHEAAQFLKPAMQYAQVALTTTGRQADVYTAIRGAEMLGWTTNQTTGAIDPKRLTGYLGILGQAEEQTHGRVNERVMLQLAQTGSLALKNLSETGLRNITPLAAEMGGFRAGTGLQAIYRNTQLGIMPARNAAEWEKYGLVNPADVTKTRGGGVSIKNGGFRNQEQAVSDPVGWIQHTVMPALAAAGMNRQQSILELGRMFSTATGMRVAGVSGSQLQQILKDLLQQAGAQLPGTANTTANSMDPTKGVQNFLAGWDNLKTALGGPAALTIGRALTWLGATMTWFATEITKHPELTKWLLGTAIAIGVFAAVLGTLMLAVAPLVLLGAALAVLTGATVLGGIGFVVAGFAAIAAGIAVAVGGFMLMRRMNWKGIGDFFIGIGKAIWDGLMAMRNWISNQLKGLVGLGPNASAPGTHPFTAPAPGAAPGPFQHFRGGHSPVQTSPVHDERYRVTHPDESSGLAGKQAMNINLVVDGKVLSSVVLGHLADTMESHHTGPAGYDRSLGPARPSQAVGLG